MAKAVIDNNMMKASSLVMGATGLISEQLVLLDITYQYKTDEAGEKTKEVEYVKYKCIDTATYSSLMIKVETNKPVISNANLEASEDAVYIRIPVDETLIKPYAIEYGKAKVSIIAPFVELVKTPKA
ncbi:MAG: hypothetical protein IJE60_02490 [Tyzzerella sp.]|nr:hypothetical protein [Tyzzerella sp.]